MRKVWVRVRGRPGRYNAAMILGSHLSVAGGPWKGLDERGRDWDRLNGDVLRRLAR